DLMRKDTVMLVRIADHAGDTLAADQPGIADLATAFAIKRRLVDHDETLFAGSKRCHFPAVLEQGLDLAFGTLGLVAEKLGGTELVEQAIPDRVRRRLART